MHKRKEPIIKEEIGLIFVSDFSPYDSAGNTRHGLEYMDATNDIFLPIKNYRKDLAPLELFKTNNLKKGFWLGYFNGRESVIKIARRYENNLDSSSCYFAKTFGLLLVRIKYKVEWRADYTFCDKNQIEISSANREIFFSYRTWSVKILEVEHLDCTIFKL